MQNGDFSERTMGYPLECWKQQLAEKMGGVLTFELFGKPKEEIKSIRKKAKTRIAEFKKMLDSMSSEGLLNLAEELHDESLDE